MRSQSVKPPAGVRPCCKNCRFRNATWRDKPGCWQAHGLAPPSTTVGYCELWEIAPGLGENIATEDRARAQSLEGRIKRLKRKLTTISDLSAALESARAEMAEQSDALVECMIQREASRVGESAALEEVARLEALVSEQDDWSGIARSVDTKRFTCPQCGAILSHENVQMSDLDAVRRP